MLNIKMQRMELKFLIKASRRCPPLILSVMREYLPLG
jgi:mitochondrial fission protein ELM1